MFRPLPIVLFLSISFFLLVVTHAAEITEADIKKMKVKDLKQFCIDRDEECKECVEKSDYINAALRVMKKKPNLSKTDGGAGFSGPAPTGKLWEVWSTFADEVGKEQGLNERQIKVVSQVVEDFFMQHGKSTANKLKKTPADVLKTSLKSPYYAVGRKHLVAVCKFAAKKGEQLKSNDVRKAYEKVFIPWMTNVGIENTNPMYEWIKVRDEL